MPRPADLHDATRADASRQLRPPIRCSVRRSAGSRRWKRTSCRERAGSEASRSALRRDEVGAHPRTAGRPAVARVGEPAISARLLQPGRAAAALLRRRAGSAPASGAQTASRASERSSARRTIDDIRRRRRGSSCAEASRAAAGSGRPAAPTRAGGRRRAVPTARRPERARRSARSSAPTWSSNATVLDPLLARVLSDEVVQRYVRSGPCGITGPMDRFGRPGITLIVVFGKRKWN